MKSKIIQANVSPGACSDYLFIFLQEVGFLYFPVVLLGREPSRLNQKRDPPGCKQGRRGCVNKDGEVVLTPSGRSACPCVRGCRRPGRPRSAGTWSNTAAPRGCEQTGLERRETHQRVATGDLAPLHASPWQPGAVPLTALHSFSSICCICSH